MICAKNPFEAFETARKLGVDTILTSGQKNSCIEGVKLIKKLVERSSGIDDFSWCRCKIQIILRN